MGFLFFLLLIAATVMFIGVVGGSGTYVRFRTAREDALHDQIQHAMNWSPDFPYKCEDGKYRDAYGKEYVSYTLEEFIKKHEDKE